MKVEVNELAVLLAAISSMVVGSIWYLPGVFGNSWMKMTKSKMGKGASGGKMAWMYGSVFVASLFTAYILAHVIYLSNRFFGHSYLVDSISTAAWMWIGFVAARFYVHDTFEERRKMLTILNAGHELVTLLVMAIIIGALGI
jgi:hypothetical protein